MHACLTHNSNVSIDKTVKKTSNHDVDIFVPALQFDTQVAARLFICNTLLSLSIRFTTSVSEKKKTALQFVHVFTHV